MDRIFGLKTDPATVVQKVIIEQLTFGVVYNLAILTYRAYVVEGMGDDSGGYHICQSFT